jgi:hypothetical protein
MKKEIEKGHLSLDVFKKDQKFVKSILLAPRGSTTEEEILSILELQKDFIGVHKLQVAQIEYIELITKENMSKKLEYFIGYVSG